MEIWYINQCIMQHYQGRFVDINKNIIIVQHNSTNALQ